MSRNSNGNSSRRFLALSVKEKQHQPSINVKGSTNCQFTEKQPCFFLFEGHIFLPFPKVAFKTENFGYFSKRRRGYPLWTSPSDTGLPTADIFRSAGFYRNTASQPSSRRASETRACMTSGFISTSAPLVLSISPSCVIVENSRVTCSRRQPIRPART